jgi:hypothetical protein
MDKAAEAILSCARAFEDFKAFAGAANPHAFRDADEPDSQAVPLDSPELPVPLQPDIGYYGGSVPILGRPNFKRPTWSIPSSLINKMRLG